MPARVRRVKGRLRLWALALLLLAALTAGVEAGAAPAWVAHAAPFTPASAGDLAGPPDCSALLAPYPGDAGQQQLADPLLETETQVSAHLQAMRRLHACLADGVESRPPAEQRLFTLSAYFIEFASPPSDGSSLELVDLARSSDPAVQRLRQEAHIPPPPGLVFLRIYPSRQAMPALLLSAFADPQVAGVTILARYVAVLDEQGGSLAAEVLQSRALPRTISHELVHAYLISAMGLPRSDRLPRWYHEGLAIYFSGSEQTDTVVAPDFTLTRLSTADYRQYALNFAFLQASLGRRALLEHIRRSVEAADESLLLQDLNLSDGEGLARAALAWQARRVRTNLSIALGVVVLLALGLLRLAPEAECACGYQGRRERFASGVCPSCGRPVSLAPSLARRLGSDFAPACEVCGRRFYLGRARQVQRYPEAVRLWAADEGGHIRQLYARRVCLPCRERSQALEEAYHQQERLALQADRQALRARYQEWLARAPLLEGQAPSAAGQFLPQGGPPQPRTVDRRGASGLPDLPVETLELSFAEALEAFTLAALPRRYAPYLEAPPPFELLDRRGHDLAHAPPPGYVGVIQKTAYRPGMEVVLLGSVYRTQSGKVKLVF